MSNKVNGLWAVNSSSVFMFFDSVNSPSVWRFEMKDGVESWRMIPGVKNAQAVRGVAAAYRADGGTWLDPNGPDYAQAVSEIGDVPLIVERGDCMVSSDCGDYTAHGVSLSDADREHGWELSYEDGGMVVSRDISFLTPAERDHPEMCETYDDLPVVTPQSVEPEPEPAETVSQPQQPMSELGGHTIAEFAHEFDRIYGVLYDADGNGHSIDYGSDIDAFDNQEYPRGVLEAFNAYRKDFVSSDRESAAFIRALRSFAPAGSAAVEVVEPEPVTVEIPEVPPIPSKDTPKVIAQHGVKARVVTIPGGKSVKELADVFGGYVHKPRGFRDSKGRRVAYVAFDGKSGVVAYRDYYQRGSDQTLEESVAAYLAQHEIVEVA